MEERSRRICDFSIVITTGRNKRCAVPAVRTSRAAGTPLRLFQPTKKNHPLRITNEVELQLPAPLDHLIDSKVFNMDIVDINWNPSRKELKIFSLLLIVFFAVVAGLAWRKGASAETAFLIAGGGAVVGIVGVLSPAFIRIVYVAWMAAVFPIGFVVSNVVLAAVFYGVVWPIGILTKLTGRDALQLRFDREAKTYWNVRQPTRDPRRYFRQY